MAGKQRIFLAVLFLFGVPAVVTTVLLTPSAHHEIVDGAQPGGVLRGITRDEADHPLPRIDVEAFAVGADGAHSSLASVRSSDNGEFEIAVSPVLHGHYELVAGGGERLLQAIAPLEFRLGPASLLDVDFARSDGSPVGEGTYTLEGAADSGLLPGWSGMRFQRRGSLRDGRLSLDSLPPVRVHLLVRLASGEKVDLMLELEPGKNRHRVEL